MAPDAQPPTHWAATVRDQLELGRRRPIANVLAVGERLGVFIVSTGSQAGPLFVAGLADGSPVAAIPAGPDGVSRRWATACAIGALAVTPSGKGIKAAMRLGAELLIPVEGLIATHRPDWSADQNAARWGVPATVYGAVAGRHGLTTSEASPEVQEDLGWEQSAALMTLLARLRSDGLRLEDVSRELGYPTSVLRALFRGLALTSV